MNSDEIFLSVIVPVYNEEKRLDLPLPGAIHYLQSHFSNWEIIYSDDGSTDGTYERLLQIQKDFPHVFVIVKELENRGKGNAVCQGIKIARGNIVLFSDADFSTPIEETQKLLEKMAEGYDIVIGSRGLPDSNVEIHQSWARETMGKIFNLIIRTLLPVSFQDTQCGFKMFRTDAIRKIVPRLTISGFAFDVELLIAAETNQLKIAELPVTWRNVRDSKVHPIRNSLEMLKDVLAIRYRLAMGQYSE